MVVSVVRWCRWVKWSLALILALASCDRPVSLLGNSDEPSLYLVLSGEPIGDSSLYALLASTTDLARLRYRSIEKFDLRRRSDGARYGWVVRPRSGIVPLVETGGSLAAVANIELPWGSNAGGFGRSALTRGDTFDLTIETEGEQILGVATLPPALNAAIRQVGDSQQVYWSLLGPSFRYSVRVPVDTSDHGFTAETTYTIKADAPRILWPTNPRVVVTALDSVYMRYLADTTVVSVGLSGALGIFTGVTVETVPLVIDARTSSRDSERTIPLWRPR